MTAPRSGKGVARKAEARQAPTKKVATRKAPAEKTGEGDEKEPTKPVRARRGYGRGR